MGSIGILVSLGCRESLVFHGIPMGSIGMPGSLGGGNHKYSLGWRESLVFPGIPMGSTGIPDSLGCGNH